MTDASFTAPGAQAPSPDPTRPLDDDEGTELEAITAELTAELEVEIAIEVPTRPGYAVLVSKNIDNDLLRAWRRRARMGGGSGKARGEVDELRFAAIGLAAQTRAILRNGRPITVAGEPVTFSSPAFQRVYGTDSAVATVRALYGLDGHVIAAAGTLFREAGYGDELDVDDEDPTAAG